MEWPRARVRDRAIAPALGFTVIVGVMVAVPAAFRRDLFALFGGLCMFVGGVLQLRRPNLTGVGFRDARLFVDDGRLTIDGKRFHASRALRSDTKEGAAVVLEDGKGSTVAVLCPTRDERHALLRALGLDVSPPLAFAYTPAFARYLMSLVIVLCVYGVIGKAFHLLPASLGWRWLWLLAAVNVAVAFHRRIEISRDELRVHRLVLRLRDVVYAEWECTKRGTTPAWLVVRGNTFRAIRVLVDDGMAERAAQTVQRRADRARARAKT